MAVLAITLLVAGCGSDDGREAPSAAESTTATTEAQATPVASTTLVIELTTETPGGFATELTEGLRYHASGTPFKMKSGEIDVISPADGDGHPTVVIFHGGPRFADKNWAADR